MSAGSTTVNLRRRWASEYVRFLARMARREPGRFVRDVWRWNLYVVFPRLTRPRQRVTRLRCDEVDRAAAAFARDGLVVLVDALTPDEVDSLRARVGHKADAIVSGHETGDLPSEALHGHERYSFGEYGHSPEWEDVALNERVVAVLRAIWEGRPFRAVGAGGDFVRPGGDLQPLHNDMAWRAAGETVPSVLTVNFYVSEVGPDDGPLRHVPGTAGYPPPPNRIIERFEPDWMRASIVTGSPGCAIIRDARAWHGGTPNTGPATRLMPNVEYVLTDAPVDDTCGEDLGGSAILDQVRQGRWIAEFAGTGSD